MSIIEKSNNISNREALKEKIHEIHNFLRNNGIGYGMNALKVFNVFYGLKKIEENTLLKDKISENLRFSTLLDMINSNSSYERIFEYIDNVLLNELHKSEFKNLIFYEIPKNIKAEVYVNLILKINEITNIEKTCNVLLSGKIYEYFIGRDDTAISELGAYFTDRHIVEYIYNKLNPNIDENYNIKTMIDMYGGSGGFTTGYINYLLNKDIKKKINWKNEINKIYHYDMNEDVVKSAGLEIFCLTGELPNKENLKCFNSFSNEFNDKKYFYVITNPPYGGDKNKKSGSQIKRDKIKEYIKNILKDENLDKEIKNKR
jgi:hypothetical protein